MILSSLLSGLSFAAFAVFGWGVQLTQVFYAIGAFVVFILALSLPALVLLVVMKGIAFCVNKYREN